MIEIAPPVWSRLAGGGAAEARPVPVGRRLGPLPGSVGGESRNPAPSPTRALTAQPGPTRYALLEQALRPPLGPIPSLPGCRPPALLPRASADDFVGLAAALALSRQARVAAMAPSLSFAKVGCQRPLDTRQGFVNLLFLMASRRWGHLGGTRAHAHATRIVATKAPRLCMPALAGRH